MVSNTARINRLKDNQNLKLLLARRVTLVAAFGFLPPNSGKVPMNGILSVCERSLSS